MSSERVVFAVGAHPDDVEFGMSGTLSLLVKAGFTAHMMNVARSNLDSNELPEEEITRIRRHEAERSAEVIGATYHPPFVDDLMIFYEDTLLRQMAAVVREIRPRIVLLPSPNDYMEDHTNTSRLVVTACFSRAMRHYTTIPPRGPTAQDIYLYHAQPHLNRDGMRNLVVPELFVNVTGEMETKVRMLGCHESQRRWLDETQALDDYIESMRQANAQVAHLLARSGWQYAEGFRRHSHVGFSAEDRDCLAEVLAANLERRKEAATE
ncbi:MAG TPA: PIG-L family deacetylase [Phycisphaerae bacterium]|nr:PIG-L family deacetylase [Phycisphaerae bacterium]HRY70317.1 PIG-L family deacetylase [Phycisphaerae bacterium]HSA28034.1 PIG-L family deacetylase [Phycisphaerae bacterium]